MEKKNYVENYKIFENYFFSTYLFLHKEVETFWKENDISTNIW